jgi:DedD protein
MRFEIGPGGGFVILVGLLGLSAAVFFLGMISGREMAQSEQNQSQLASVYPMPAGAPAPAAPPAVSPPQVAAPAARPSVAPVAAATPKTPPHAAVASAKAPRVGMPEPAHKTPPRPTLASVPPERSSTPAAEESDTGYSAPSDSSVPSNEAATGAEEGTARAPAQSAATRHHGYNIVIDAAMDHAAANRMASRLFGLGYTSHIVPSQINGQTWYRVEVGPYPTSDDARAAQAQLRAAYTARYVNRAHASSAAAGANGANPTDSGAGDAGASDSGSDDSGGADSAPTD